MADRFTSRISVTLAAGASSSTPHLIVRGGVATAPQAVWPDRLTSIQVDTVDATNLNCSNPGSAAATVVFLCEYIHSIQATPAMTAPGWYWKGGSGGGLGSQVPFNNDYYVQVGAVADAGARLYPTIAAALAAIAVDLAAVPTLPVVIKLAATASNYAIFNPDLPVDRSITFETDGNNSAPVFVAIEDTGTVCTAPTTLTFRNCAVFLAGATAMGTLRSLRFEGGSFDGDGFVLTMAAGTLFNAIGCDAVADPRVVGAGAGMAGVLLLNSPLTSTLADVAPILFDNVLIALVQGGQLTISESNWTLFRRAAGATISFVDVSADLTNTGPGAAVLCNTAAGTGAVEDFRIARLVNSGGGTINLGLAAGSVSGAGLQSTNVRAVVNGATTVSTLDGTILCDATAGTCALTLPDADSVPIGTRITVMRTDAFAAGANDVTIAVPGTNTINGVAGPYSLNALVLDRPSVILESNTTGTGSWNVIAVGGRPTTTDSTNDNGGLGGNATAQTANGIAAVAAGAATCVITNAYVTATSRVLVSLNFVDATLTSILSVVPGAGSFTVTGNAAATAKTKFSWTVLPG